jgi:hypothetical protein
MMPRLLLALAVAFAAPAWSLSAHDPIGRRVTWTGDVSRIVQARCVRCHADGGRGPMSLATYEDAKPWARAMREEVLARRMPKWHAARGYGDFKNDPSLSAFEIALVAAWADGGAPRGPDAPPAGTAPGGTAGDARASPVPEVTMDCGRRRLASGAIVAFRPHLERGESVAVSVRRAGAAPVVLGWIRDFDPEFPETYWLREPVRLGPGSEVVAEGPDRCAVTLSIIEPRSRTAR